MRGSRVLLVATLLVAAACEDGPEQVFEPFKGDTTEQNGFDSAPWTQDGSKGFDEEAASDSEGRARFCDEAEASALLQQLVTAPILPDVSVGGVPLWTEDGSPLHADSLVGRPEDGKFCDPWGVYLNAFTWGPMDEIIVFFDEETRLVTDIAVWGQYLGTLEGDYTKEDGTAEHVLIKTRQRVRIGDRLLDQYAGSDDEATKPDAWMNHANITAVYRMVRETFFNADPLPDSYDCVADKRCDLIYEYENQAVPQSTYILFTDSGLLLIFTPEGHIDMVDVAPVRLAPFEVEAEIDFDGAVAGTMSPRFTSLSSSGCTFDLGEGLTWAAFKERCIDVERTLNRINYNVETQRDAVDVQFNGMDLGFLRTDTATHGVFRDGERPSDAELLYFIQFTRTLDAAVAEFKPWTLVNAYRTKLQQRLNASIHDLGGMAPADHPLWDYDLVVPPVEDLTDDPQRIGEILYTSGAETRSLIPDVVEEIQEAYYALITEERQMVDPRVLEPVYLIEPFVDAVIEAFTHGASEEPAAFKVFETTDDKRWSIGFADFFLGGVPYRVVVQYSLNYGAITAVSVETGFNEVDEIFQDITVEMNGAHGLNEPYYTLSMSSLEGNPYVLGGSAIRVGTPDRQLGMLDVELTLLDGTRKALTVPGEPMADGNGFMRQLRGERWEFVPADLVRLYGKETSLAFYVTYPIAGSTTGAIGRIVQSMFKGSIALCDGLPISFGDNVRAEVEAWQAAVGPDVYRDCEVVYNYSGNGNVLLSVVSLSKKVELFTTDGRALSAAMWR